MKTPIDFCDKVYSIFEVAGLFEEIKGKAYIGGFKKPSDETVQIRTLDAENDDDTVDACFVSLNLWIPDVAGATDFERFRYLIKFITDTVINYKDFLNEVLQDSKLNNDRIETDETPAEYFRLFPVFTTLPEADTDAKAYSWWSIRLNCFYEH